MKHSFEALDFQDFAERFLCEKVDGELSRRASELNAQNTKDANNWAIQIFNDIKNSIKDLAQRMAKKGVAADLNKKYNNTSSKHKVFYLNGKTVQIKLYEIGSWANEEVPVVDIILSPRKKIEVNIYDSDSILVKLSPSLVRSSKYEKIQVFTKTDKIGSYIYGILEEQLWQ